jgi:hypothetical protein
MNTVDKIVTEWAFRCKKGYPDLNNPQDIRILKEIYAEYGIVMEEDKPEQQAQVTITDVKDLLQALENDQDAITYIYKYIKGRSKNTELQAVLNRANIHAKTISGINAPRAIFDILAHNDDLEKYMQYVVSKHHITYTALGKGGNLLDKLAVTGISKKSIEELVALGGFEGGRGVGKGEVALALLVDDLSMREDSGDLDWKGKYVEVKGSGGRMGGRNTKIPETLALVKRYKQADPPIPSKRLHEIIPALLQQGAPKDQLRKECEELADSIYPQGKGSTYITAENLDNPKQLRAAFQKAYFYNYLNTEKVDYLMLLITNSEGLGRYINLAADEVGAYIDEHPTITSPINLDESTPQITISKK